MRLLRLLLLLALLGATLFVAALWMAPGLVDVIAPRAAEAPAPAPAVTPVRVPHPQPPLPAIPADSPAAPPVAPTPASIPAPPPSGQGLLIPVAGVRAADLRDTYTQSRSAGRSHDAIDIGAPRGTAVMAAADGVVLKLFLSERGGIALYQLGRDGATIYYYAHLERYAPGISEGMMLRRGDLLGYVGDTGNAGAGNYHLHFGVSTTADPARYWGGVAINPYPLLMAGSRGRD